MHILQPIKSSKLPEPTALTKDVVSNHTNFCYEYTFTWIDVPDSIRPGITVKKYGWVWVLTAEGLDAIDASGCFYQDVLGYFETESELLFKCALAGVIPTKIIS